MMKLYKTKLLYLFTILMGMTLIVPPAAHAGALEEFDLEGIECLQPNLPLDAVSQIPGGGTTLGIVTIDPVRGTRAIVTPMVSTDATGIVSGVAEIDIYEGEIKVDSIVVPVTGRSRISLQARIRISPPAAASVTQAGFPSNEDELVRTVMHIAMRGYFRNPSTRLPYFFALNAVANFVELNGDVIRGEERFRGRTVVRFANDHLARALVFIELMNFATVEFLLSQNTLYQNIRNGTFYGEAGADTSTIGNLAGGLYLIRLAYYNELLERPGRVLVRGKVDRMRFLQQGLLFLTLAQALSPTFTVDNIGDQTLALKQLVVTPAAYSLVLLSLDPRLIDDL